MTPFFHGHESITFMSKEVFHKQILHHKLRNLMASFFHDYEPKLLCPKVFYQHIFHHKLSNLMTLFFHEHESITFKSKEDYYEQIFFITLSP